MKSFECKKCKSDNLYIKQSNNNHGLYCGDCGTWIKWLGKEELRLAERFIEINKVSLSEEYEDEEDQLSYDEIESLKESVRIIEGEFENIKGILAMN